MADRKYSDLFNVPVRLSVDKIDSDYNTNDDYPGKIILDKYGRSYFYNENGEYILLDDFNVFPGTFDEEPTTRLNGEPLQPGDMYYDTNSKLPKVYNGEEWDDFKANIDNILVPSDSDPDTRDDGSDLQAGDMYYNTDSKVLRIFDGEEWGTVSGASDSDGVAIFKTQSWTGDGDTKEFSVDDGYTAGWAEVYLNGANVTTNVDISDGIKVVFDEAPADSDEIFGVFYNKYELSDIYDRVQVDQITNNIYVEKTDSNDNEILTKGLFIIANTSNNAFTLKLPSSPEVGNKIIFADKLGTFDSNNLTIDGNGNAILGDETLICDEKNAIVELVFLGNEWKVK